MFSTHQERVISKSWRYIACLNFVAIDASSIFMYGWIGKVLELHQGLTLDGFKFRSSLNRSCRYTSHFDDLIDFAMRKKVRRLEIEENINGIPVTMIAAIAYMLSEKPFKNPSGVSCMKYLKHLTLTPRK
ncbi:hypothetical protein M0R45_031992 [Rubus argutus]|uniref:Uncharacterized protein n=1 Tax=Rubus argutus TaxID=59490 RepID=A0AAW1WHF7_RUBAR